MDATALEGPGVRRLASNRLSSMKLWDLAAEVRDATGETYLRLLRTLSWTTDLAKTFYTNGSLSLDEFEQLVEFALRD